MYSFSIVVRGSSAAPGFLIVRCVLRLRIRSFEGMVHSFQSFTRPLRIPPSTPHTTLCPGRPGPASLALPLSCREERINPQPRLSIPTKGKRNCNIARAWHRGEEYAIVGGRDLQLSIPTDPSIEGGFLLQSTQRTILTTINKDDR